MVTRGDELVAPFARLSRALGVGDRDHLAAIVARSGWGPRTIDQPLLPSGVRHGVPWGLSLRLSPAATELRVFLEAQADPPSAASYLAAADRLLADAADAADVDASALATLRALGAPQRLWHAVSYGRDRPPRYQAYACVPDTPALAWDTLAALGHDVALRDQLPARTRVTMFACDLARGGRRKLYALVPDCVPDELPLVDRDACEFARMLVGDDRRLGWLACYAFAPGEPAPRTIALHFGAAVHGDPRLPSRLADELARRGVADYARAIAALGSPPPRLHFVAYTQRPREAAAPLIAVHFVPEVAR